MITIRRGADDDCAAFLDLLFAAFAEHRGKILPESSVFRETIDSLRAKLQSQTLLLAYRDSKLACPIGGVICEPKNERLYLGRLAVHPKHRGDGVAQLLIQRVEDGALRRGYGSVFLEVRIALMQNIALFERYGYEIKSSHAHDGFDHPTYYRMEKQINDTTSPIS